MSLTRRQFLGRSAAGAFAFTYVPSRVFGANEKLNIAAIGSGGMGGGNINAVTSQNIVALCDVEADPEHGYLSGRLDDPLPVPGTRR